MANTANNLENLRIARDRAQEWASASVLAADEAASLFIDGKIPVEDFEAKKRASRAAIAEFERANTDYLEAVRRR
jgi:hypothetical protein